MLTYSFDEGTAEVWNSTRCDNIHTLVHHSVRELALCKRHGGEDALHGECVNGWAVACNESLSAVANLFSTDGLYRRACVRTYYKSPKDVIVSPQAEDIVMQLVALLPKNSHSIASPWWKTPLQRRNTCCIRACITLTDFMEHDSRHRQRRHMPMAVIATTLTFPAYTRWYSKGGSLFQRWPWWKSVQIIS